MKKGKKIDYDLNMNDYSQMYDYNLITLRLITQLWRGERIEEREKSVEERMRKVWGKKCERKGHILQRYIGSEKFNTCQLRTIST